jgi:uncharacterized protein YceH (UPF0502 family)
MQVLDPVQLRVLGSLVEKEITTPENYPLSLNALVNACNQRSSREPVMELAEEEVRQAIHVLEDLALVAAVRDARVPKYEHRMRTVLNLRRDETAVLCLLLLRGPQTPGELRSRADRMYSFDDLAAVQATLERLAGRAAEPGVDENAAGALNAGPQTAGPLSTGPLTTGPLTTILPRQPGSREARYAHLLGGPPDVSAGASSAGADRVPDHAGGSSVSQRVTQLEAEVSSLTAKLESLQERVDRLESATGFARSGPVSP